MTIARLALASLLLVTACKDKKEQAKPTPVETKPAEPVKPEAPKATEAAPTPPPPTPDKPAEVKPAGGLNTQAEYEKRAVDLTDQLLDVFAKNGTSCDKLATALDQFMDKNKDAISGAKAFEAANPDAEKQIAGKMQDRQKQVATKVGPVMKKCEKHEGLRDALARLSSK